MVLSGQIHPDLTGTSPRFNQPFLGPQSTFSDKFNENTFSTF